MYSKHRTGLRSEQSLCFSLWLYPSNTMRVPVLVPIRTYVLSMAIMLRIITPSSNAVPYGGDKVSVYVWLPILFKSKRLPQSVHTCGVALSCERFIIDSCNVCVCVCGNLCVIEWVWVYVCVCVGVREEHMNTTRCLIEFNSICMTYQSLRSNSTHDPNLDMLDAILPRKLQMKAHKFTQVWLSASKLISYYSQVIWLCTKSSDFWIFTIVLKFLYKYTQISIHVLWGCDSLKQHYQLQ